MLSQLVPSDDPSRTEVYKSLDQVSTLRDIDPLMVVVGARSAQGLI